MENFQKKVEAIVKSDPRYKPDAYEFVMQSLAFTQKKFSKLGHVSGRELLAGIKELALEEYGPMARVVFEHWGITKTEDFGQIVFGMVQNGLMSKTENDRLADFENVYDFKDALDIFKLSVKDKK